MPGDAIEKPLLKGGVSYEIDADRIRVFGTGSEFRMRGAALVPVLATILARLDGTCRRRDIVEALPAPVRPVGDQIVSLLERHDMVVEGPRHAVPGTIPAGVIRFAQEAGGDWENRLARWSAASVRVEGPVTIAERIRDRLVAQGIGAASTITTDGCADVRIVPDLPNGQSTWTVFVAFDAEGATVARGPVDGGHAARGPDASGSLIPDLAAAVAAFETLRAVMDDPEAESIRIARDERIVRGTASQSPARTPRDNPAPRTFPLQVETPIEAAGKASDPAASPGTPIDFDDDWSVEVRTQARLVAMYGREIPSAFLFESDGVVSATVSAAGQTSTARGAEADAALEAALTTLIQRLQTSNPTHNPVRDFAVLTSERRSECLGSMWGNGFAASPSLAQGREAIEAQSYELPSAHPVDNLDRGGNDLDPFGQVAEIVRHTVIPHRLEIVDAYATNLHRPLPSGGGKYGVTLLVEGDFGHGRTVHRVDPVGRTLIATDIAADETIPAESVKFHLDADANAMLPTYGEFGLCLLLIEAGAMRAQIEMLARTLGLAVRRPSVKWHGSARERVLRFEAATVALSSRPQARTAPRKTKREPSQRLMPATPELDAMIDAILRAPAVTESDISLDSDAPIPAPFALTGERTSNGRIAAGRYDERTSGVVADIASALVDNRSARETAALHIVMPDEKGTLAKWDWREDRLVSSPLSPREISAANDALGGNAAVLTIHGHQTFASDGDAGSYVAAHLAAGEMLQVAGLVAAHHGWYARGYRALPDASVGAMLGIDRRPLLQIQIGPRSECLMYRVG